jgi:hypothetical protein
MITEKENLMMMLRGEQPEWIPIYTYGPVTHNGLPPARRLFDPTFISPQLYGGDWDIWGVRHVHTDSAGGAMLPDNQTFLLPLEKLKNWREIIKAPDVSGYDWESLVKKDMEFFAVDRTQTAMTMNLHGGYFQTLMAFMGFEDGLLAFYDEPELVHELLAYLSDFYMMVAEKTIDLYKPDIIAVIDDTAAWNAPFISREMYEEFIFPHHDKWAGFGRERGLPISLHNCGKCEGIVDLFVKMGVRIWDPAQTCNDLDAIQARYGNDLVIAGGWDGRDRLIEADVTEEELRQSVRDTMDRRAVGGGFVWCGGFLVAVGDEVNKRKNEILMDEVDHYGRDFYKTH